MDIRPFCRPKKIVCPPAPRCAPTACCVCKCKCGKSGRYRQPTRPKSYAPVCVYMKPEKLMENATIYRKSYLPTEAEKLKQIIPPDNLGISSARFAKDTINKMSYPGWCNIKPPEPVRPCGHNLLGKGPMQEITTTRHDYVPKPFTKAEVVVPGNNIFTSNEPVSDKTVNRLSYQPVQGYEKVEPIRPKNLYEKAEGPISGLTIHKASYQPVPLPEKDDMPWAKKKTYTPPTQRMTNDTIYRKSYLPNHGITKTEPIRPANEGNPLTDSHKFDDTTIYHASYLPNPGAERPNQVIPPNNLTVSNERMSGDTVNKMSYKPNYGFRPPEPSRACSHKLLGEGPMQEITTTRHDYVPKPISMVQPFKQQQNIFSSSEPLSNQTVNRLSYLPNSNYEVVHPIRPPGMMEVPTGKMESCTIQKMSYQPVGPVQKMDLPWARKKTYESPKVRMAGDTIYNMSYDCPGDFVSDDCCCTCGMEEQALYPPPEPCLKPILA